ncbi:MAG: glycosyltransferase family 39 protein [Candidatus Aenigmarchaeota archaeon]|nr:glycosyltransferase family 39 protein [Candidatus Aenigmarchaeota archaeon]
MTEEMEIKLSPETVIGFALIAMCVFYLYTFESVTLNSPIAFGDEGFHAGTPKRIVENMEIPKYFEATKIYSGAYFRPPLPHLLYAGAMLVFGTSDTVAKMLTPMFSFFTGIILFLLVKRLHSKEAGLAATFLYFVTPSMITYNVLIYSEAPLVFFFTFFLYSFCRYMEEGGNKFLILSGISAGFVALSKFTGLLIFPTLLIMFFLSHDWKKNAKSFAALFVIALVIGSASNIRQVLSYNGICQPRIPSGNNCYLGSAPADLEKSPDFSGYVEQSGTNLSFIDIGLMNYVQFGYTPIIYMLFVAGTIFGMLNKNNSIRGISAAGLFLYGLLTFGTLNARTEDAVRDVLIGVVPLFILGGIYLADSMKELLGNKTLGKQLASVLVALIIIFVSAYGYGTSIKRVGEMNSVKQFSPDYIEACKWMDSNIPAGSYTINLWGTPCQFYAPKINSVWTDLTELPAILFSGKDEKVIPLLERNGINYIVAAKFSISDSNVVTSTPSSFVKYISNSTKFSLVYENQATLIYKINYS